MERRILIIDDDPDTLALVGSFLVGNGFEMATAPGGSEGIALASTFHPHLILLDVLMPEMSGLEVFKNLQSDSELSSIPVIFLTAIEQKEFSAATLVLGAERYITKPFEWEDLLSQVNAVLGKPAN